jgi:hypothetical protein
MIFTKFKVDNVIPPLFEKVDCFLLRITTPRLYHSLQDPLYALLLMAFSSFRPQLEISFSLQSHFVLKGQLTMSGDIFDCHSGSRVCYWHLIGRGQGQG